MKFSSGDIELIKILQDSIPIAERPFAEIGKKIGLSEEEVINKINEWKRKGVLRRFGAVVTHQKLGRETNALSLWNVPQEKIQQFKILIEKYPEITHCYTRKTHPDKNWQYNVYAMIHTNTKEQCEEIAFNISENIQVKEYILLYTVKEFKKKSVSYF